MSDAFGNLFDTPLSQEDITEALKADLLPVGWHVGTELKYEEKAVATGPNIGRPFIRVQATLPGLNGRKAFFNASPIYKVDVNGKPDFMYRLFAGLSQAVGGGSTAGEVISKLGYATIDLRVSHGKDKQSGEAVDNVVAIRAPKQA